MNQVIDLRVLTLIAFALTNLALLGQVKAVDPTDTFFGGGAGMSVTTGVQDSGFGFEALFSNTTGFNNTAVGAFALFSNVDGVFNTATGFNALASNTGDDNTATGFIALSNNTTGSDNTATGLNALALNTAGNSNTANGSQALNNNITGNNNTAVGFGAGLFLTTGDNNIDIGNSGIPDEANTIRVGTQGTQTKTFIAGVSGAGVSGMAVKVNAEGQLGTAPSSARFKEAIKPIDKASETILALKPVSFRYKKEIDPERTPQFGLVAEEVDKVNPDLVARDAQGKPYTVRYDAVNAMLLNEFLKAHKTVQEHGATIAHLQKQIEALTAGLQKVSAQLEVRKPAAQIVVNNQ
jgi:hypothetical protein